MWTKTKTKTCENPTCNAEFIPTREWQRFCSKDCRYEFFYNERKEALTKLREQQERDST